MDDLDHLPITLDVRGTVSTWDPVTGAEIARVVIQRSRAEQANARTASGIPVIVRPYQIPTDPQRPAQLARRAIHAAGVAAWQALTHDVPMTRVDAAETRARLAQGGSIII